MEPGEIAPGAADGIEETPAKALHEFGLPEMRIDDAAGFRHRAARHVDEPQRAERQRNPVADGAILHVHQLEAAAAEIADDAIGRGNAGDEAKGCELRLVLAGKNADRGIERFLGAADEAWPVGCLAGGGRGYGKDLDDADLLAERAEPPQRRQRPLDGVCRQVAGQRHAAPEPAQDLFVDDRRRRAPQPVIDHQTHRIRPDIDDGHRPKPQRSGLQILDERHFRALTFFEMSPEISGGNRSLSELPRPESDGLFMKYSCALKGSSPG